MEYSIKNFQNQVVKPLILCVDDERIILDSLKMQLASYFEGKCIIELAESAEEGLEIIEELLEDDQTPHVVISDQIMPNMRGDEFLSEVSKQCPNAIRILLTGQADKDDIISAINKAGLYRYIAKPWDSMDLNLTVKEALLSYTKSKEIENQRDQLLILNQVLEEKVKERTKELRNEKKKADQLLQNILPDEIVDELKTAGKVAPRHYDLATIAFIDIVGFTLHGRDLTPQDMIDHLNVIFKQIDEIVDRHGLEKIKTMGDGYMFGGGIPMANDTNPEDVVRASLEIIERINEIRIENEKNGLPPWNLRIGVHSGELVAGVIGTKKFAYDVWGKTVNTASRIESAGEPGKVNVSKDTYHFIKNYFDCEARGEVAMKNMGTMEMFFVTKPK